MRDWGWRYWAVVLTVAFILNLGAVLSGAHLSIGGLFVWPIILGRIFWKDVYAKDPVKEARDLDHSWTDADNRKFKALMEKRLRAD